MKSKFLIAASSSGSGKTTLSLGLMRALVRRGLSVQPFKCGPDYIDTQFHAVATGCESINLDCFMASEAHVRNLFDLYSAGADVSVAEGVMGMFDGYSRMKGSSADIARLLGIPVVLLVNAASTAYSVAATIYGFKNFRPDVRIAGVIFNRVASESHYAFLKEACADAGVECLGYLKKMPGLETPSRHLGLTLTATEERERYINTAADAVEANVDIDRLLKLTEVPDREQEIREPESDRPILRVAVARDEAFNFIYPANLRALERHPRYKCEIVYFSPLRDCTVPEADLVYFPGGYPELFATELEKNRSMRESVKEYIEAGGRVFAECGGLIYMSREIDGRAMCGGLPIVTTMTDARLTLGYRSVDFGSISVRGHEFHYSRAAEERPLQSVAQQTNVRGAEVATPVYRYKNLVAGYTHLYWAETDILKLWNL